MKKYINNTLSLFLFLEGLYFLYSFVLIFTKVINTFDSSNIASFYAIIVYIATMLLFIVAGIGLWKNKNWAIICGWIAILLPQLLKFVVPLARIPLQNNYTILVINILILVYLSTQWNKLKNI
ncbi:MAG: hypothetical protein WCC74_03450 [Minisyncoccia bacterium]